MPKRKKVIVSSGEESEFGPSDEERSSSSEESTARTLRSRPKTRVISKRKVGDQGPSRVPMNPIMTPSKDDIIHDHAAVGVTGAVQSTYLNPYKRCSQECRSIVDSVLQKKETSSTAGSNRKKSFSKHRNEYGNPDKGKEDLVENYHPSSSSYALLDIPDLRSKPPHLYFFTIRMERSWLGD
ncbi:uncharacterized protein LOC118436415 [Folsomia candida]|uniref:uncharacterized protein LOC118436415 n=1 Tax=Folsomia candida TaxID=158441 RepID=UPI00160515F7|nr:uncharacterized protein LOC118436415 [Folsomia candida]